MLAIALPLQIQRSYLVPSRDEKPTAVFFRPRLGFSICNARSGIRQTSAATSRALIFRAPGTLPWANQLDTVREVTFMATANDSRVRLII